MAGGRGAGTIVCNTSFKALWPFHVNIPDYSSLDYFYKEILILRNLENYEFKSDLFYPFQFLNGKGFFN